MTKEEATKVLNYIEAICAKYGLWYTVETEKKPDLRTIRVKEISMKIDK